MCAVLHHLKHTAELAVFVAHGHIDDVDEQAGLIDPKLSPVLLAAAQLVNDLAHHVGTLLGVAVHHLAAYHVFASRKDAVVGVGIEAHEFVLVDKRDVDGQMLVDEVDLFEGEPAGGHIELVAASGGVAVFAQQGLQVGRKACGNRFRGLFGSVGSLFRGHIEESETYLLVALLHLIKLLETDHGHRSGIENGLLLVHEVAAVVEQFLLLGDELFLAHLPEQALGVSDDVAHEVVESPHSGRRPCKPLLLEHRIELVLLALVVYGVKFDTVVELQPLILDHGILHQVFHGQEQPAHLLVLPQIVHDGVSLRQVGQRSVHQSVEQMERLVDVFPDTLVVTFLGHGLLDIGNVVGVHLSHLFGQFPTGLFEREVSCVIPVFDVVKPFHLLLFYLGEIVLHFIFHTPFIV